jgi:hypothetical protein
MRSHRTLALIAAASIASTSLVTPSAAHVATFKSSTSLVLEYEFARGKVNSPMDACRSNRSVTLFKARAGADLRIASAKTTPSGGWAIFKTIPQGVLYAKVAKRVLDPAGHSHTCRAATSVRVGRPVRVTPSTEGANGWQQWFEPCVAATQPAVAYTSGPGTPPLGGGSVQLNMTPNGSAFIQWEALAGKLLRGFKRVEYYTYVASGSRVPEVALAVDLDGPGGETTITRLTRDFSSFNQSTWQRRTVTRSNTWKTNLGESMTLENFNDAYPDATFVSEEFLKAFRILLGDFPCENSVAHIDDVAIYHGAQISRYDFEPE